MVYANETPPKVEEVTRSIYKEKTAPSAVRRIQGNPTRFLVPKLGIDTAIESVGMDNQGRMDVPKDDFNVAWYNLGFKPGEHGSAVIAGHFDTPTGAPAIFYELEKLENGDEVIVQYEDEREYRFTVVDEQQFAFDQVPLEEIFNSTDRPRLNLITCDGAFDPNSQNYSQRLVVYAVMNE